MNLKDFIDLVTDCSRRDLTINAMAMEQLEDGQCGPCIDPYGGQVDLRNKIIRHTSEAFAEDPLRVLRACRFRARLGFTIADETMQLMQKVVAAGELAHLSKERIWKELEEGLASKHSALMISSLEACGALQVLTPYKNAYKNLSHLQFLDDHEKLQSLIFTQTIRVLLVTAEYCPSVEDDWKIPTKYLDAIKLSNLVMPRLKRYETLDFNERLDVLLLLGIHKTTLIKNEKAWAIYYASLAIDNSQAAQHLIHDCEKLSTINQGEIAKSGPVETIKQRIREEQLKVISNG